MNKIKEIENENGPNTLIFICPGCNEEHAINRSWGFNNNYSHPTITPSIKVTGGPIKPYCCHSFIKEGKIQYLGDCTHNLKNKTIDLPGYD